MFSFMRPYRISYGTGIFLYNAQGFVFSFVVGLIGSNVIAGVNDGDTERIVVGFATSMGVFVALLCLIGFGIYLGNKAIAYATLDLKQKLFRCFVKTDLETSHNTHSGEGVATINTDADTAITLWWDAISTILRPIITVTFSLVTIFVVDWRIGLSAVALGLLGYFLQNRFVKPLAKIGKERLDGNADAIKSVSDVFQGALLIRAFNLQDSVLDDASQKMERLKLLNFKQAFISMWQRLFMTFQGWLSLVIVFGFGGWLVATQGMEFSVLFLVLPLVEAISKEMGKIGQGFAEVQAPLVAAERIFALIDNAPKAKESGSMDFDGSTLHIRGLNFKYQNAEQEALCEINLDVNAGEMVAFVGYSGSGKSTLLKVIFGFYEREKLGMTLGGTSLDNSSIIEWRKRFAYVDQSCMLFNMTIKENIALGRKGTVDDTDIINAAKQAFVHDFIEGLAEKYNTPCGEKGGYLSGGQKQRIAIARALLKSAPVLLFDEATSALDTENESAVMSTIEHLRGKHTILITTHKLGNTIKADKIVVMDKGRIAEIGTHYDLLAKSGLYKQLWGESNAL
jgi:ABC-type multidrug transport system fused ATPase/permease subunit